MLKKIIKAGGSVYMCSLYYFFSDFLRFQFLPHPPQKTWNNIFKVMFIMQIIPPNPQFVDLASSTIPSSAVPDLADFSLLYTFIAL